MVAYEKTVCNDNFNLHVVSFWLWRFGALLLLYSRAALKAQHEGGEIAPWKQRSNYSWLFVCG